MYFGAPGSLIEIPHPRGGVQTSRIRPNSTFQTASGGARFGKTVNGKRKFTLNYERLFLDTYADLLQYEQGHMGPGPFVLHDPSATNWLTPNQAAATSLRNDPLGFTVDECSYTVYDNYTRSTASGWGTSTSGHAWTATLTGGAIAANVSVSGTQGQIAINTNASRYIMTVPGVYNDTYQEMDFSVPLYVTQSSAAEAADGAATVGEIRLQLLSRFTDSANHYRLYAYFQSNGFVSVYLTELLADVETTLDTEFDAIAYEPSRPLRVALETTGSTIRGKIWDPSAGSPPEAWLVTSSAATKLLNGQCGVRVSLGSGNTNTLPYTVSFDNYVLKRCDAALLAYDNYTRTVSGSWGTADDTVHSWGSLAGAPNAFFTNGTTGRITLLGAVNTTYSAVLGTFSEFNMQTLMHNSCSATPTGASITTFVDFPFVDTNNYYRLQIVRTTSNTVTAELLKVISGVSTSLDGPDTIAGVNATTNLALEITRDSSGADGHGPVWCRVWDAAGTKPTGATLLSTDITLLNKGSLRVGAFRNTSNTNTNPVITWDNVSVDYLDTPSVLTSTPTPVNRGPRALEWTHNGLTGLQVPWLTIDPPVREWPGIPVISNQAIILSMQARGGGTDAIVTLTPKLIWLNYNWCPISITSGTPVVTSTSYASMTVSGTPPSGAAYVSCVVEATSGLTAGSIIYLDQFQLERGSSVTEWRPGTGIFPVALVSLNEQWPWQAWDYRESATLVLQETGP
jgi:hypothetical protein